MAKSPWKIIVPVCLAQDVERFLSSVDMYSGLRSAYFFTVLHHELSFCEDSLVFDKFSDRPIIPSLIMIWSTHTEI